MCPIPGRVPIAIRNYWDIATILMQNITSRQSTLSLVMKRRSSAKNRHVNPIMELVVTKAREINKGMTLEIGSVTRKAMMERIIKMTTVINLETVFKRREISGCATTSTRNMDGIIPTSQDFMLNTSVIQVFSVFWLIMNIGSCQAPL